MARFCISCGAPMPDNANNCPQCGKGISASVGAVAAPAPAPAAAGGLADNLAGMLAYITFIPAIIFLVIEPYNKNRFIRFHAFQCIFVSAALFAIHIVLMFVPIIGAVISLLVSLAALALWIVLLIKAYGGQKFKLPIVGDMAENQANTV